MHFSALIQHFLCELPYAISRAHKAIFRQNFNIENGADKILSAMLGFLALAVKMTLGWEKIAKLPGVYRDVQRVSIGSSSVAPASGQETESGE